MATTGTAELQQAEYNNNQVMSRSQEQQPQIIVQGGGYRTMISDDHIYKRVTEQAANVGYAILKDGHSAIDAVEKAVCVFEENAYFNAGRGSCLNGAGEVECDAMIMNGASMETGAVMSVGRVLHPVSLSRKVMDSSPHCALSGNGALKFAEDIGFPVCDPEELKGDYPNQKVDVGNNDYNTFWNYVHKGELVPESQDLPQAYGDTVSAVAMDINGSFACAMSTGGIHGKREGRVSDASLVGCGGYANEFGAVATTGHGESIMKMTLAREVVTNMEKGQNAQEAAENALKRMKKRVKGHGGVIAIDHHKNLGKACTTPVMVWASIKNDELESGMMKPTLNIPDEVQTVE